MENSRERSSPFSLESPLQQPTSRPVPGRTAAVPGDPPPPVDSPQPPLPSSYTSLGDSLTPSTSFPPPNSASRSDFQICAELENGGLRPSSTPPPAMENPRGLSPASVASLAGRVFPTTDGNSHFLKEKFISFLTSNSFSSLSPVLILQWLSSPRLRSTTPVLMAARMTEDDGQEMPPELESALQELSSEESTALAALEDFLNVQPLSDSPEHLSANPTPPTPSSNSPLQVPSSPSTLNPSFSPAKMSLKQPLSACAPDPVRTGVVSFARHRHPPPHSGDPPPPSSSPSTPLQLSCSPSPQKLPPNRSSTLPNEHLHVPQAPDPVVDGLALGARRRRSPTVSDDPPPPPSSSSSPLPLPCSPLSPIPSLTPPFPPLSTGPSPPPCAQQSKDCAQQPRQSPHSTHSPSPNARSKPREKSTPLFEFGQTSFPSNPHTSRPSSHDGPAAGNHPRRPRRPRRPHRIPPPHNGKGILPTPSCHFLAWPPPPPPGFAYVLCLTPLSPYHRQPPVPRRRRRRSNRRGSSGRKAPFPPPSSSADPPPETVPSVSVPPTPSPSVIASPEQPASVIVQSSAAELPPFEFPRPPTAPVAAPLLPEQTPSVTVQLTSEVARSPAPGSRPSAQSPAAARPPTAGSRSPVASGPRPRTFSEVMSSRIVADLVASAPRRLGSGPSRHTPPQTRSRSRLR